ncbi:hypothetical protein KHS38_00010 [Mucilaginibacter sp. Bleaf8]|uniref:hypothetical protein n=1 Tax=Mucilaginibacter sp. Bleaf8 TaxID=2834430 RepID=UPI001BD156E9|nr:hypothetical protein [Mucilaginibacter sp. Bleaf8]MBS7562774.1 hypothetical protein [Mucilaginibacter sp. Bleaf8]
MTTTVKKDEFYTGKGGWDYARFPLIKPYEARLVAGFDNWIVRLDSTSYDGTVPNVKSLNIIGDSLIILYSKNTLLDGLPTKQSWYVILPARRIEKGFKNHEDYTSYLDSLGILQEPKLLDIHLVNKDFQHNDRINW